MDYRQVIEKILEGTDIKIDGKKPYDIKVHNSRLYRRILRDGSLGLGEAYMDGWWSAKRLDEFFTIVLKQKLERKVRNPRLAYHSLKSKLFNQQKKSKARRVGKVHYDLGNELFERMLGKSMNYSCAYWKNSKILDQAQNAKLDLICKKINLKKGDKILDIGCGWGSFAGYAAKNYGASVVGITISAEQAKYARQACKGLPVKIRLEDYRNLDEKFDHIVSIGMFEHVGYKNYREYFKIANRCLKDGGLFLLHTIGASKSMMGTEPWIGKYIFPNGNIPAAEQITSASKDLFLLEDWHSFGDHYDKTLMAWHANFNKNWKELKFDYDDRFFRMWNYYLLSSAASFRARKNHVWQIVLSKNRPENYRSVR